MINYTDIKTHFIIRLGSDTMQLQLQVTAFWRNLQQTTMKNGHYETAVIIFISMRTSNLCCHIKFLTINVKPGARMSGQWLRCGLDDKGIMVQLPGGIKTSFSCQKFPKRVWDPCSFLFNGNWVLFPKGYSSWLLTSTWLQGWEWAQLYLHSRVPSWLAYSTAFFIGQVTTDSINYQNIVEQIFWQCNISKTLIPEEHGVYDTQHWKNETWQILTRYWRSLRNHLLILILCFNGPRLYSVIHPFPFHCLYNMPLLNLAHFHPENQ
jgi:hypothetical protein